MDLVKFLLTVLDSPLSNVKNSSGAKAQIVKALKSMLRDLSYGEQVSQRISSIECKRLKMDEMQYSKETCYTKKIW